MWKILLLLTQNDLIREIHVFLQFSRMAYLEQTEPISTMQTLIYKKYSFQTQTQFSQGNNLLEAPASNTDVLLSRDKCVSST
jgi:hypothetical protein